MAIIDNYTPHIWTDKELITATKLNRIENTIAAINDGAINTVGDSTMNGSLNFINQNQWNETPVIYALGQNGNLGLGGTILYKHSDNSGNPRYQWYFRQQIPRGSDTSVYEQYCFPTVDTTRTDTATYTILTTKTSGLITSPAKASVSVDPGIYQNIVQLRLSAGSYIITGACSFATNTTGYRWIGLCSVINGNYNHLVGNGCPEWRGAPASSDSTVGNVTAIVQPTGTTTYYLNAYQNTASSLSVTGAISAIRIV